MKRDVLLSMNFTIVRNLHNINFTLQAYSIHYNLQSFSVPVFTALLKLRPWQMDTKLRRI